MPWYISDNNRDYEVPDSISQNDHEQVMSYLKNARSSVQDEANNDFAQTGQVKIPLDTPVQEKSGGIVGTIKGIVDGSISASDVGKGLWDTVTHIHKTIPGWSDRVNSDDPQEREQAVLEGITTIAGTALTGSPAVGGAGTAGMFIGKKGRAGLHGEKTASEFEVLAQDAINEAKQSDNPEQALNTVWKGLGVEQVPDKGIRSELSDQTAKIPPDLINYSDTRLSKGLNGNLVGTLQDTWDHPELFKAYPDLKDTKVKIKRNDKTDFAHGTYDWTTDTIHVTVPAGGATGWAKAHDTINHEIQHAIQFREEWSLGGQPSDALTEIRKAATTEAERFRWLAEKSIEDSGKEEAFHQFWRDNKSKKEYKGQEGLTSMMQDFASQNGLGDAEVYAKHATKHYTVNSKLGKMLSSGKISNAKAYTQLYGEVEARNTANRRIWSDESRSNFRPSTNTDLRPNEEPFYSVFPGISESIGKGGK